MKKLLLFSILLLSMPLLQAAHEGSQEFVPNNEDQKVLADALNAPQQLSAQPELSPTEQKYYDNLVKKLHGNRKNHQLTLQLCRQRSKLQSNPEMRTAFQKWQVNNSIEHGGGIPQILVQQAIEEIAKIKKNAELQELPQAPAAAQKLVPDMQSKPQQEPAVPAQAEFIEVEGEKYFDAKTYFAKYLADTEKIKNLEPKIQARLNGIVFSSGKVMENQALGTRWATQEMINTAMEEFLKRQAAHEKISQQLATAQKGAPQKPEAQAVQQPSPAPAQPQPGKKSAKKAKPSAPKAPVKPATPTDVDGTPLISSLPYYNQVAGNKAIERLTPPQQIELRAELAKAGREINGQKPGSRWATKETFETVVSHYLAENPAPQQQAPLSPKAQSVPEASIVAPEDANKILIEQYIAHQLLQVNGYKALIARTADARKQDMQLALYRRLRALDEAPKNKMASVEVLDAVAEKFIAENKPAEEAVEQDEKESEEDRQARVGAEQAFQAIRQAQEQEEADAACARQLQDGDKNNDGDDDVAPARELPGEKGDVLVEDHTPYSINEWLELEDHTPYSINEWLELDDVQKALQEYVQYGLDINDFFAQFIQQAEKMNQRQFESYYSTYIENFIQSPNYKPKNNFESDFERAIRLSQEEAEQKEAEQKQEDAKLQEAQYNSPEARRRRAIEQLRASVDVRPSPEQLAAAQHRHQARRNSLPGMMSAEKALLGQQTPAGARRLSLASPEELADLGIFPDILPGAPILPGEAPVPAPVINNSYSPVLITAATITAAAGIYGIYKYGARIYAHITGYWHTFRNKKHTTQDSTELPKSKTNTLHQYKQTTGLSTVHAQRGARTRRR